MVDSPGPKLRIIMRISTTFCLTGIVLVTAFTPPAQGQSCKPLDSQMNLALQQMKMLVVSSNSILVTKRQQTSIPAVDSSTVTVVTDTKVCDKVLTAFKNSLNAGASIPTSLFVMKVGSNTYVALHSDVGITHADVYRVMNRQYTILSRYTH
jgi:hypothetical protein